MIKGLVFAETYQVYRTWIDMNDFDPKEYPLITTVEQTRGRYMVPVFCVGSMCDNVVYNSPYFGRIEWEWQMWSDRYFAGC